MTKRTLSNEAAYTHTYYALGRLTKQTGPQGLSKTYSYDVSGNLVKETDQSDRSNHYSYDKVGRLLMAKNTLDKPVRLCDRLDQGWTRRRINQQSSLWRKKDKHRYDRESIRL